MMDMAARRRIGYSAAASASRSDGFRWDDEAGEAGIYLLKKNQYPAEHDAAEICVPEQPNVAASLWRLVKRLIAKTLATKAESLTARARSPRRSGAAQDPQRRSGPGQQPRRAPTTSAPAASAGLAFATFLRRDWRQHHHALDTPSTKAATSATAMGPRQFHRQIATRSSDLNQVNQALVDDVIVDELRRASQSHGPHSPRAAGRRRADTASACSSSAGFKDARVFTVCPTLRHQHRRAAAAAL